MAPTGTSAKARKGASAKSGGPKPIVPAIPLPYVKRQAAARAAAAAAPQVSTDNGAPSVESSTRASPSAAKINGDVIDTKQLEAPEASPAVDVTTPDKTADEGETDAAAGKHQIICRHLHDGGFVTDHLRLVTPSKEHLPLENGHHDDSTSTPTSASASSDRPTSSATEECHDHETHVEPDTSSRSVTSQNAVPTSAANGGNHAASHVPEAEKATAMHAPIKQGRARPPAPISPTRLQNAPPFHPANRLPPGLAGNIDMARGPRPPMPNGPPMHHSHPSNGSAVHFGAYSGSATSSPAPPHSGGIAPPPGMPLNDGRQHYMGPPGNGFPPMMPFGADMMPGAHVEGYGHSNMAYPQQETFPPYGNTYGPSTPHSFQESQSSGHPNDSGAHHPYQPGHPRNGGHGYSQDFHGQDFSRMPRNQGPQQYQSVHGRDDDADGLVDYLVQQFGLPETSDSAVELRFADNRAAPVRMSGHRLIFARSSAIAHQSRQQSADQRLVVLETDDKWIRPDTFYMAVQRLYGLPLLPLPPPMSGMNGGDFANAGSLDDQLDFALAYAAAGKLLEWDPVLQRGCEIAAQLINWQTVEKALEFALDGFVDKGSYESYKYEIGSKILLHGIANFIIANLPPTFSLDTAVKESRVFSRLPVDPGMEQKPAPAPAEAAPIVVRGSQNPQGGRGHRHQLSNIQFGDLSLLDGANGAASQTPKASQQARPLSHATLSRVLLSLPFGVLKMILESAGTRDANGQSSPDSRYRVIHEAVAEREARRIRVIEAVLDGRVRDAYGALQQIRTPEPRSLDRWGILGWQEEVLSHSNGDMPTLARHWAPLRDGHNVTAAEFP